jgi:recombination protein RecA
MSKNKWISQLVADFGVIAEDLSAAVPKSVPTRSPSLNWATGNNGFQPGKITILFGPESVGKSLLAYMAVADVQRSDPEALFVWFDAEFSFNLPLFKKMGGDPQRLIVRKTNDPLLIFDWIGKEMLEMLQDGAPIRGIIIDSIKAIRYPKEVNMKQTTDQTMGGSGSKYLPSALKLVIPVIAQYNLLTFFIQQATLEIDSMKAMRNPYVMTEGRALRHAADLLLEITKLDTKNGVVEDGNKTITGAANQTGHKVRIKVKKNRLGPPARMAEFTWHYELGMIDQDREVFELAKSLDVISHPINPDTGKANVQMWTFANYTPIRGEENMFKWVQEGGKSLQADIYAACCQVHPDIAKRLQAAEDLAALDDMDLDI